MEARLAAYRAEKRKVAEKTERREFWLNIFTLAPLRLRLAALVVPDRIHSQASSVSIPQTKISCRRQMRRSVKDNRRKIPGFPPCRIEVVHAISKMQTESLLLNAVS